MTLSEAQDFLARVKYKAGWVLRLEPLPRSRSLDEEARLLVSFTTTCAVTGAPNIPIHGMELIPIGIMYSTEHLQDFIIQCLHRIESHETKEWFKVDGVAPYYPH